MYYGVFTKRCAPDGLVYLRRDGSVFFSIKVTPKYQAKSAPKKPSSLTAIQDIEIRALAPSRQRLPERSLPDNILYFFQT